MGSEQGLNRFHLSSLRGELDTATVSVVPSQGIEYSPARRRLSPLLVQSKSDFSDAGLARPAGPIASIHKSYQLL
jgi:hypothetical protein